MRLSKFIPLSAVMVIVSAFAVAQEAQTAPTIKHVPIARSSPISGKEMYKSYCAVCHGTDATGEGPAASALKLPPTNLTQLAKNNGGQYPSAHVAAVIRGQADLAAHGSKDMPVWGPLFSSISNGHEAEVQQRIANLVEYIGTLQSK